MKFAHLADLHLGFRQYSRQTPQGINQREADVAAAFRRAIDAIIDAKPDAVLIAGDLFHSVRPTNPAILDSFNQFRRLRDALPASPVVIIAGNHDTPRSVETGTILKLFEALDDVYVVASEPKRLRFESLDLSILCVPHAALATAPRPTLHPERGPGSNVLLVHGEVAGMVPEGRSLYEYGGAVVEPGYLHPEEWSYVALGHYHIAHKGLGNAWYPGALEYTSLNPWGELREGGRVGKPGEKGWLLVTLEPTRASVDFQRVKLSRRHIDLPAISGEGVTAAELNGEIAAGIEAVKGGVDDQIVRQVIYDVPRSVARDIDHGFVRELKSRALHYHLDLRRPESKRIVGIGAPGRRQTLREMVEDYLSRREVAPGTDRKALVALGRDYLEQVEHDLAER